MPNNINMQRESNRKTFGDFRDASAPWKYQSSKQRRGYGVMRTGKERTNSLYIYIQRESKSQFFSVNSRISYIFAQNAFCNILLLYYLFYQLTIIFQHLKDSQSINNESKNYYYIDTGIFKYYWIYKKVRKHEHLFRRKKKKLHGYHRQQYIVLLQPH